MTDIFSEAIETPRAHRQAPQPPAALRRIVTKDIFRLERQRTAKRDNLSGTAGGVPRDELPPQMRIAKGRMLIGRTEAEWFMSLRTKGTLFNDIAATMGITYARVEAISRAIKSGRFEGLKL